MVFSSGDKIFIKNLVLLKGYSSRSRRKVGIKMTSMYCCERFEKRPAWIVSPATDDHVRCAHQRTLMLRETWGEGQRRILHECPVDGEDVASDLGDVKQLLHLRAGQRHQHIEQRTPLRCCNVKHQSFTGPELWPANSPDLNPVDYRIWGLIQEHVYQTAIRDIDELKELLIVVFAELKQSVIDKAIEQWRPRLRACVQTKGHHFGHLVK